MSVDQTEPEPTALAKVRWPVRTERLTIRPGRPGDADAIWAYRRIEEVSRWLSSWCRNREAWSDYYAQRIPRTLVIELDGRIIGDLMLPRDANSTP